MLPVEKAADRVARYVNEHRRDLRVLACMSYDGTADLDEKLKTAVMEASILIFYRNIEDKDVQERLLAPVVAVMTNQPNILSSTVESLIASPSKIGIPLTCTFNIPI